MTRTIGVLLALAALLAVSAAAQQQEPHVDAGWSWGAMLQVMGSYDSNALFRPNHEVADVTSQYSPSVSAHFEGRETLFDFTYIPSYSLNRRFDANDSLSQSLHQSLSHKFSRRTSLFWNTSVQQLKPGNGLAGAAAAVGQQAVDQNLLRSHSDNVVANTAVALTHQTGRFSSVNFQLDGGVSAFRQNALDPTVTRNSRTYNANGNFEWTRQLSERRSVSLSVRDGYFLFRGAPNSHQYFQELSFNLTQAVGKFSFQAGAGPAFREFRGVLAQKDYEPGWTLNASMARLGRRSQMQVGFSRRSQIGLVQDTVSAWSVDGSYDWRFAQAWTLGFNASVDRTESPFLGTHGLTTGGVAQLSYQMTPRLGWTVTYQGYNLDDNRVPSRAFEKHQAMVGVKYRMGSIDESRMR